jgi:hypothetical protein
MCSDMVDNETGRRRTVEGGCHALEGDLRHVAALPIVTQASQERVNLRALCRTFAISFCRHMILPNTPYARDLLERLSTMSPDHTPHGEEGAGPPHSAGEGLRTSRRPTG